MKSLSYAHIYVTHLLGVSDTNIFMWLPCRVRGTDIYDSPAQCQWHKHIYVTHLPSVSDTQTMKCSHSNVNNLLALQTLNQLRFSYMSICPMAKAKVVSLSPVNQDVNAYKLIILNFEKIYHNYAPVIHISMLCEFISHILLTSIEEKNTYSPCPHLPRLGQCQGELCPTFNLYHTLTT